MQSLCFRIVLYVMMLVISTTLFAQAKKKEFAGIDRKALAIPESRTATTGDIAAYINENFSSDADKTRAAFIWVASSVSYDLENMFNVNFYEKKEEKIARTLKTRKGVCENYAMLFTDICAKAGLKSFVIEGFTIQSGFTDYIPHAWSAARIDTSWFLFDPTWGAGYVENGRFVKKINNNYFKVAPAKLIKSHMPFDYLWQLMDYPVTTTAFYEGKTGERSSRPYFNYRDSIAAYEKMDTMLYYEAAAARLQSNGMRNTMQAARLEWWRRSVDIYRQNQRVALHNQQVNQYNAALRKVNMAIDEFNEFIAYYNKRFMPIQPDSVIQAMIDAPHKKLKDAAAMLGRIETTDETLSALKTDLSKSIADLNIRVIEQQTWLRSYFAKGKTARKSAFTTYTRLRPPVK